MDEDVARSRVPDVVGFDAIDACEMVRAAGLTPFGPRHEPPPEAGTVVAQQPAPTDGVMPGQPVVLWTENRRASGDRVPDPTGTVEPA